MPTYTIDYQTRSRPGMWRSIEIDAANEDAAIKRAVYILEQAGASIVDVRTASARPTAPAPRAAPTPRAAPRAAPTPRAPRVSQVQPIEIRRFEVAAGQAAHRRDAPLRPEPSPRETSRAAFETSKGMSLAEVIEASEKVYQIKSAVDALKLKSDYAMNAYLEAFAKAYSRKDKQSAMEVNFLSDKLKDYERRSMALREDALEKYRLVYDDIVEEKFPVSQMNERKKLFNKIDLDFRSIGAADDKIKENSRKSNRMFRV